MKRSRIHDLDLGHEVLDESRIRVDELLHGDVAAPPAPAVHHSVRSAPDLLLDLYIAPLRS
jgi:hypothetical protein